MDVGSLRANGSRRPGCELGWVHAASRGPAVQPEHGRAVPGWGLPVRADVRGLRALGSVRVAWLLTDQCWGKGRQLTMCTPHEGWGESTARLGSWAFSPWSPQPVSGTEVRAGTRAHQDCCAPCSWRRFHGDMPMARVRPAARRGAGGVRRWWPGPCLCVTWWWPRVGGTGLHPAVRSSSQPPGWSPC